MLHIQLQPKKKQFKQFFVPNIIRRENNNKKKNNIKLTAPKQVFGMCISRQHVIINEKSDFHSISSFHNIIVLIPSYNVFV